MPPTRVSVFALAAALVAASLAAATMPFAPRGVEPPPFITPAMIADHLTGARPFTDAEALAADFNRNSRVDVGDIVVRVNQFFGGNS